MKWYLQGQTSSKWTSQGFEVRSTRLFTNKCILRQVNDMNHLSGWPVSSSGYLRSSLFLILVVRKSYCLCCQSISSIYSFSHPLTLSLITVPSLMVLLLPQLFCFPWNPTKLPPPPSLTRVFELAVSPDVVMVLTCSPSSLYWNVTFSKRMPVLTRQLTPSNISSLISLILIHLLFGAVLVAVTF